MPTRVGSNQQPCSSIHHFTNSQLIMSWIGKFITLKSGFPSYPSFPTRDVTTWWTFPREETSTVQEPRHCLVHPWAVWCHPAHGLNDLEERMICMDQPENVYACMSAYNVYIYICVCVCICIYAYRYIMCVCAFGIKCHYWICFKTSEPHDITVYVKLNYSKLCYIM